MEIVNKKKFYFFLTGIILMAVLAVCIIAGYFFIRYQIYTPLASQAPEQDFEIKKGQGVKEIAFHLEDQGLIKYKTFFEYYVFYKNWTSGLQAGQYSLSPSLNIAQIAEKIAQGKALSSEIQATIPEGFTLKQIDARLVKLGLIQSGELSSRSHLEGYLFPDTYRFEKDAQLSEIISKMRENFDKKLTQDLRNEIVRQNKTIKQIIIMASLIEKEVAEYKDRQIVSGIFWDRLAINYPLQSCATIAYVLGIDKWRYSIEDTEIDSSYNTYQNKGLPPGPICNPGIMAVKAALYPEKTDFNFFLSKPDGETIFSKTLEEHNENKAKYLD